MPLSCFLEPALLPNLILVFLMWDLVPLSIPAFSSFESSYLAGKIFNPWECKHAFFLLCAIFLFFLFFFSFKTRSPKGLVDAHPSCCISSWVSNLLQSLKNGACWAVHSPYSFSNWSICIYGALSMLGTGKNSAVSKIKVFLLLEFTF